MSDAVYTDDIAQEQAEVMRQLLAVKRRMAYLLTVSEANQSRNQKALEYTQQAINTLIDT